MKARRRAFLAATAAIAGILEHEDHGMTGRFSVA